MKMIIRMFCAVALVAGALSLTGCGDKKADEKAGTNAAKTAEAKKADAAKKTADAAQKTADAAQKTADAAKQAKYG